VWRERLFWVMLAGFVVSVWQSLVSGPLIWVYTTFFPSGPSYNWTTIARQVPLLLVAVILARGQFGRGLGLIERCLASRLRLAIVGGTLLACGALIRLLGPFPVRIPAAVFPLKALFLFEFFSWSLFPLLGAIVLLRKHRTSEATTSVWRDRVFWMAGGGLLVGIWQSASLCGLKALVYPNGDVVRNLALPRVIGFYKLVQFSPLLAIALWYRWRLRSGKEFRSEVPERRTALGIVIASLLASVCLQAWSVHLWLPQGREVPWPDFWVSYAMYLQWLWPFSLGALAVWLAPRRTGLVHTV
jgi:hypothetical protein